MRPAPLRALLLAMLTFAPPALRAEPMPETFPPARLPGESAAAARRLAEVQKRTENEQWSDVVEEYQRLLDEAGDELAPLDPMKPQHCVSVRRLCHLRIAALPPAALRLYRTRVDEQAKKWLDQGTAQRDPALLRRLVEQMFCSRHTDRALELLGDLAFERGDFTEAEHWWRLLALPASEPNPAALVLLYPDPQVDVAVVRAKQILAQLFRGERAAAAAEVKAFRATHGKAEGRLAARDGNLADILQTALDAEQLTPSADELSWPTFAGDPSRNRLFPQAPRCRWLDAPWRVPLDAAVANGSAAQAGPFYPAIASDRVVLADARSVTVYDLFTGRQLGKWDLRDDLKLVGILPDSKQTPPEVRYSVTVAGGRIYARLGARAVTDSRGLLNGNGPEAAESKGDSFLVCLGLQPDGRGKLPFYWQVRARSLDTDPPSFFEGAPVVRDGRVYLARTRCTDPTALTSVDCHDAETGTLRWRQDICEARERREGRPRYRHHLLTLAGTHVVYCSHSGAVVALDMRSGKQTWAARYPRRGDSLGDGTASPRDLAPCVFADGRLFVAPADADRIFCLDADNGRSFWESGPVEVLHLLGVARGRLIFTTGVAPRGIRALEAATGRDLRTWVQPDDGNSELPSSGRGLLAGDYVFWPTKNGLRVVNQDDGQPAASFFVPPDNPVMGNLAVAHGCLVVATAKELLGYVPESYRLEERLKEATEQPGTALPQYRLAVALADAGQDAKALEALAHAEQLATPDEKYNAVPLLACVRRQRYELLLRRAERAEAQKLWGEASAALGQAAATDVPLCWRRQALERQALLWEKADDPRRAVEAWQALLADEVLRHTISLEGLDNLPERRIDALIAEHGRDIYSKVETQALLAGSGADEKRLQRLADVFPNATATAAAMRERVQQSEALPFVYRWLLRRARTPSERAEALVGLARAYERRKEWDPARDTWQRLAREVGSRTVDGVASDRPVGQFVAEQLKRPEYRGEPSSAPALALPLTRAWHVPLAGERLLAQAPPPTGAAAFLFLLRDGHALLCRNCTDGKVCWTRDVDQAFSWAACHGDVVVVAGPKRICGLRLVDGGLLWQLDDERANGSEATLTCFHQAAGRLFFLANECHLWAIDLETGLALWDHAAPGSRIRGARPGGRFSPFVHAGRDWVVVQTTGGHCWILDALTGRRLHEYDAGNAPWLRPPLALDESRLVFVPDARHLALLDLAAGKELWRRPLERDISLTGVPPQLFGSGDCLLLLVSRNAGSELQRLDAATGHAVWPKPLFLTDDDIDLSSAAADSEAVYFATGDVLRAVFLASGRPFWDCALRGGTGPWRVQRTRDWLLAFPRQARTELDFGHARRYYQAADVGSLYPSPVPHPFAAALPTLLVLGQQAQAPGQFPVLLCDPGSGSPVQRLNFATPGPQGDVTVQSHGVAVILSDGAWGVR